MGKRELRAAAEAYLAQTQAIHGDDACDTRTTEQLRAALAAPEHAAPQKPSHYDAMSASSEGGSLNRAEPVSAAPPSVSPQATTGECAGVFDMIAARKVWWAALSDRGDPNQLTGTWDAFSAGYYAAFDEARRRQGGTAEGADWVRVPRAALQKLKRDHDDCEDCWYSCATLTCDDKRKSDVCDCGADAVNKRIDEWLSAAPRPDAGEK